MNETEQVIQAAALVLMRSALELIQNDPHQWSERGCQTCRAVSTILREPFGCVLFGLKARAERGRSRTVES